MYHRIEDKDLQYLHSLGGGRILLGMSETADLFGLSIAKLRYLCAQDAFPVSSVRLSNKLNMYDIRDLANYLENRERYRDISSMDLISHFCPNRFFLTLREVSNLIGWNEAALRNGVREGRFPIFTTGFGGRRMVDKRHFADFLDHPDHYAPARHLDDCKKM